MSHSRGVGAVFAALALGTALASGAFAVADAGPRALAPVAAPRVREGSAVALAPGGAALYVASEEHGSIHVFRLPDDHAGRAVRVPGAPANLVVLGTGEVLATIRDPGLLLVLRPDAQAGLVEEGRVPVAADAWGLAASKDGALAYVTSAWTRTVTAIDVARREVLWSVPVAREPRGIVAHPAGPIYVSHLTSGSITRIDVVQGQPVVKAVALPPSPLRTPRTGAVDASLGYALALSPDGTRLYAPRQALGVVGFPAWFGAATVDVLLVPQDEPLAPMRAKTLVEAHGRSGVRAEPDAGTDGGSGADAGAPTDALPMPHASTTPFAQPRAIVYSASARSVIVAGEGDTGVHAFDALAPDPTLHPVASPTQIESCIAPSAVALSEDESVTYVYCRASFAVVALADYASQTRYEVGRDPLEPEAAAGRKLFYTARRDGLSEGFACSGCHPEGRDDGHVWHEVDRSEVPPPARGAMAPRIFVGGEGTLGVGGVPRQTPMLAGRLRSPGPYGWLGLDADLDARIATGAALHRWQAWSPYTFNGPIARQRADLGIAIGRLAAFVRAGLVAPPRDEHTPTDLELRGKALFESKTVACASCHASDDSLPAMVVRLLPLARRAGFDAEDAPLKAPSLRFLSGTPPYLHDGSAATLAELLDENRDRMGHTNQLNAADRAALVAYLETL